MDVNNIYDDARVKLLTAAFNWPVTDLVLTAWPGTPNFVATDKTLSQITARGFTARGHSQAVTSKTVSADGTAQTNQVLIPTVPVGASVTWFTMSKRMATIALSELILYIDEAVELPFVPNGLDLIVNPDWLSNRGWWKP
jgi:hypothetical protein